jgi:Ca-activated chloride channel family protein
MTRLCAFAAALLLSLTVACGLSFADTGVLIPGGAKAPNPAVLSLQEMHVDVLIDNGDARVRIVQIFANHGPAIQEGTYQFSLPDASTVSDFAVWDGPVRIPAVVLERKRAEEVYDEARMQAIDPGLLEMGERTDEPTTTSLFTAKIVPLPAYGTKRLELEYHQRLTVNNFTQLFLLPLKPDAYEKQIAQHFSIRFEIKSAHALQDFTLLSKLFPLNMTVANAHHGVGTFEAANLSLAEDFVARWKLDRTDVDALDVITYRSQHVSLPQADETSPSRTAAPEPGFFQAEMLVGDGKAASTSATADTGAPRTVIVLFDTSLSMQWEKLERSYAALEGILNKLRPTDRFNIVLFNQDTTLWKPEPVAADSASIAAARQMVRGSRLRGGTDLGNALAEGLRQCDAANSVLVLLTDGGSNRGLSILPGKIAANYAHAWAASPHKPKTDIFAVGDDANTTLLALLARNDGVMEHVLSTEPVDYKLDAFLSKLNRSAVAGLSLTAQPQAAKMVYPLDPSVFTGSMASWVGTYDKPQAQVAFAASGQRDDVAFAAKSVVDLPAIAEEHTQLPRLWAQARVNALLEQIAADGETRAVIDEIIRLSRKYKFVTPYTSFLAVPRSLLRPRVIRPGDPVLRVRTDEAIESVIALFPFGLTKELRHLATEDTSGPDGGRLWETRFLAPPEMKDGTYSVRLILRDTHGNTYREAKTFVIASTPPTVKILLSSTNLHRGSPLVVRASASQSTRTLTAHLTGADFESSPVSLRWSFAAASSVGTLDIPADLPIGHYQLSVTAEDIAHNMGSQEVQVDVVP